MSTRRRRSSALLWVLLLTATTELGGCGRSAAPRFGVVHRLVDAAIRDRSVVHPSALATRDDTTFGSQTSAVARIPAATIGGDSRSVMAAYPTAWGGLQELRFDAAGSVRTVLSLGDFAAAGGRVAVVAHVKLGHGQSWEEQPAAVVPFSGMHAEVILQAGQVYAGSELLLSTKVYPALAEKETSVEVPPLRLPRGARLEVSLGVMDAARDQGSVRFSVEACGSAGCTERFATILDPLSPEGAGWRDERIDLLDLGDQDVSLRLLTRHIGRGSFSLPVWGEPQIVAPVDSPGLLPPNIVMLSIDTLRRDHLDVYGYERGTAPFLRERLAAEGMVFEDLLSEATTTAPSHMTMLTSVPALVHGVSYTYEGLAVPLSTTAELLRERGYATAAITEDGPLARHHGFGLGFDRYVENTSRDLMLPEGFVKRTFEQARAQLSRVGDRPFFLFLHTFQVHSPYAPPTEYAQLFPTQETGVRANAVRAYDQEIRFVDDAIASLYEWMKSRDLLENTYFFLLSDHGEQFYEHRMLGHGTPPFEEVLRVPMIVTGPGVPRGRNASPLSHLDLLPTMLDLAGVPPPAEAQGRSFAPLLRAEATELSERPRISASWTLPVGFSVPAWAVRSGSWKLLRVKQGERTVDHLYDLAVDPNELSDVGAREAERRRALSLLLTRYEADAGLLASTLRQQRGREEAPSEPSPAPLDPEREEMLRALGYIE
jgi:arylsulfatase A-like enzyme